jgi:ferredoxin
MPPRIAVLPRDERGYPVPFFVAWMEDDRPEFRATSPHNMQIALERNLCWVCGQPRLDSDVFVIGSMCGVNRVSSEPPSHSECARWSVRACPFLRRPKMVRRKGDGMPEEFTGAGIFIERNPGVTLLWFTRRNGWKKTVHNGQYLFRFTCEPLMVEWYREGRAATRAEILESIDSGMPILRQAAALDGSEKHLDGWYKRAMRLLPRGDGSHT